MNYLKLAFNAFFLGCPLDSWASYTCASPEEIEERAAECDDNVQFSQAASQCLAQLEREITARSNLLSKQLAASNSARVDQPGNAQSRNFSASEAGYVISQSGLAELILAAEQTRVTVDGYLDHVYFPEDWDADEEFIGNRSEFIEGTECYAETASHIRNIVHRIDGHLRDLKTAKLSAAQLESLSLDRKSFQNSAGSERVNGGAHGVGGGRVPSGRFENRASDITGTEESRRKETPVP